MVEEENNEKKELSEEEKKKIEEGHNRLLKWTLGIIAFVFIIIIAFYLVYNTTTKFEYAGTTFEKVKFGSLIFYQTSFPLYSSITGKQVNEYNFFLRKDPRTLGNFPINGEIRVLSSMVLSADSDLYCKDNAIALSNFYIFFKGTQGVNVTVNNNLTCDDTHIGTLVRIQNSTASRIDQVGTNCYELSVNNCQVLEVTERFVVGTLAQSKGETI